MKEGFGGGFESSSKNPAAAREGERLTASQLADAMEERSARMEIGDVDPEQLREALDNARREPFTL